MMGKVRQNDPVHGGRNLGQQLLASWQVRKQRTGTEAVPASGPTSQQSLSAKSTELIPSPEHSTASINCANI